MTSSAQQSDDPRVEQPLRRAGEAGDPAAGDILLDLLRVLRVPGAINPGHAAMVSRHARTVLEGGRLRGSAFDGRVLIVEGIPTIRSRVALVGEV